LVIGILEVLKESAGTAGDVLEVILTSPYGTSLCGFKYRLNKLEQERDRRKAATSLSRAHRQKYYTMLGYLKQQGFIEAKNPDSKILRITGGGVRKLKNMLGARREVPVVRSHQSLASSTWTIVAFDVPEKEKRKRRWLRDSLKVMGLKMIQKSVWMGKVKISKGFLKDIRDLEMARYVEIFQITKTGSLSSLL